MRFIALLFLKTTVFLLFTLVLSCAITCKQKKTGKSPQLLTAPEANSNTSSSPTAKESFFVGANRTAAYLPLLKGKRVGVVGNQTSVIFKENGYTHLVDSLLALQVKVTTVFSPEHGFRGTASAGETVKNGVDKKTGLPIVSLYGNHKKPNSEDLKNVDVLIFDIQDVGARFYTYISTLHYVMEACAENDIPLLVFDRPNPNGSYIDGPILEKKYKSFVGMDPVPIVHGMTIGEYAKMINGEGWLKNGEKCDLNVITMKHYNKDKPYSLPVKPSPNLPNDTAINLYPSLCFFEGTNVNAGRGTDFQFQVFGSPDLDESYFQFHYTPESNAGSKHPKHAGKLCYGKDLRKAKRLHKINLKWLIAAYNHTEHKSKFFNAFFVKLAGTAELQEQIEKGMSGEAIRKTWKKGLKNYDAMRQKYLIYAPF